MLFTMRYLSVVCVIAILATPLCHSRPYRQKRPSDQRLHELETLLELSKLKGSLMEVPVGLTLNPDLLGRRKRTSEMLLQELLEKEDERTRDDEDNPRWISDLA